MESFSDIPEPGSYPKYPDDVIEAMKQTLVKEGFSEEDAAKWLERHIESPATEPPQKPPDKPDIIN